MKGNRNARRGRFGPPNFNVRLSQQRQEGIGEASLYIAESKMKFENFKACGVWREFETSVYSAPVVAVGTFRKPSNLFTQYSLNGE